MQRQTSKKDIQGKIAFLEQRVQDLEQGKFCDEVVPEIANKIKWFQYRFFKMPPDERALIKSDWDKYYKSCQQSEEATNFFLMRDALDFGAMDVVRENSAQSKEKLHSGFDQVKQPGGYDPEEWNTADWALAYRKAQMKIKNLKEALNAQTGETSRNVEVSTW